MRISFQIGERGRAALIIAGLVVGAVACSNSVTDSLLKADDPDLILPSNVNSLSGALAVANGALGRFRSATAGSESTWMFGGLLADEWGTSSTFVQNDETDQRHIALNDGSVTNQLRNTERVRTAANQAIPLLNTWAKTSTALIGEMYFIRGFAELQLANDFCNGIPLSDGSGTNIVFGDPLPVSQVFTIAVASFDSALAVATGTDNQSVLIQRAAKIGKARALMALNQYAAAAALVAGIPTSYAYQETFSLATSDNILWNQGFSAKRYTVGDNRTGTKRDIIVANAINFVSAHDPRLPTKDSAGIGQDGGTQVATTTLYDRLTPIDVVDGIDARLIEAEAALKANDVTTWLAKLNALRQGADRVTGIGTTTIGATALALLTDPGTADARVDLLFREMAFWQWGRGERLGNMRRLIRQYGRTEANTFPQGLHYKGGSYGTDVNLPIVTDEQNNPKFTQCLDRNA